MHSYMYVPLCMSTIAPEKQRKSILTIKPQEGDKETLKQNVSLVKRADSTHLSSVISGGTISNR